MGIREIARACGVSPSTVSRTLRGVDAKCASEAVKKRIFEEAQRTGYVPNRAAQTLKMSAVSSGAGLGRIAIAFGRGDSEETNAFLTDVSQAAMAEILRFGWSLGPSVFVTPDLGQLTALENVDALVLVGRCPDATMKRIRRLFPALVYIGCHPANEQYDQVISGGQDAAEMAVTKLIYSGYKRIAYVGRQQLTQRYQTYRETLRKFNFPLNRKLIFDIQAGFDRLWESCCTQKDPIDAIFFCTDVDAAAFLRYRQKKHASQPLPAIITVEDCSVCDRCSPMLTSIQMPAEEMGRMAVRLLLDRLNGDHREAVTVNFHCRYTERESFRQQLHV